MGGSATAMGWHEAQQMAAVAPQQGDGGPQLSHQSFVAPAAAPSRRKYVTEWRPGGDGTMVVRMDRDGRLSEAQKKYMEAQLQKQLDRLPAIGRQRSVSSMGSHTIPQLSHGSSRASGRVMSTVSGRGVSRGRPARDGALFIT